MLKTLTRLAFLLLFAATAAANTWSSGAYVYDGAGNVVAIGADVYAYDTAGRLLRGTADQHRTGAENRQEYAYDSFGNLKKIQTFGSARCSANLNCQEEVEIDPATNRIKSNQAAYDAAGNLTTIDVSYAYDYDSIGMMRKQTARAVDTGYVYTANDQRIAVYAYATGQWQWTLRDLGGEPLRTMSSSDDPVTGRASKDWTWTRDTIHRGTQLLATTGPEGRRHLHLDHVGTPRLITDNTGRQLSIHAYYPFGAELALTPPESPTLPLKFTGHERDLMADLHELDYMHARYYGWGTGRFLSVDPKLGRAENPQSWNRYAYALNNPLKFIDPDGQRPARVYGEVRDVEPGDVIVLINKKNPTEAAHVVIVGGFKDAKGLPDALIYENTPSDVSAMADDRAYERNLVNSNSKEAGSGMWNAENTFIGGVITNLKADHTPFTQEEVRDAVNKVGPVRYYNGHAGHMTAHTDCAGFVDQVVDKLGGTVTSGNKEGQAKMLAAWVEEACP